MKHFAQLLTALEEYRQYIEGVEKSQFPVVLTGHAATPHQIG